MLQIVKDFLLESMTLRYYIVVLIVEFINAICMVYGDEKCRKGFIMEPQMQCMALLMIYAISTSVSLGLAIAINIITGKPQSSVTVVILALLSKAIVLFVVKTHKTISYSKLSDIEKCMRSDIPKKLKRVPLDFDYPLGKVWYGYLLNELDTFNCQKSKRKPCKQCRAMAKAKGVEISYSCPNYREYFAEVSEKLKELCEPPKGEGYQLWLVMNKGSYTPISPVFATIDELSEWCENDATVGVRSFSRLSKQQWKIYLTGDKI